MNVKKNEIFILNEIDEKKSDRKLSETILALFVFSGILLFLRDFSYSVWCLAIAFGVGTAVTFLYRVTERSEKAAGRLKTLLYVSGIVVFLVTITMTTQGFLYVVDCFLGMWNARFGTEAALFSVGSSAGIGSIVLWALFAEAAVSFLLAQIRKNSLYGIMIMIVLAAASGLVLGSSDMWPAVLLSLAGFFGLFIVYSTNGRNFGVRGLLTVLILGTLILGVSLAAGSYHRSAGLEQWKKDLAAELEKIRYGEDTLPKGDLGKEKALLDGDKDTLKIEMDQPQELYLRGFVGGSYEGMQWKELPYSAYEGEYKGMLKWLSENDFSPLSQFASYDKLNAEASGQSSGHMRVTVNNTGAYRKYVYLPEVADAWESGEAHKDWNVESKSFFGARKYQFQVPKNEAAADNMAPGKWLEAPSGSGQKAYVNAESVYHSFVLDSYTEIETGLKEKILEQFFSDGQDPGEMDFDELTTKIRQVLRNNIRYTEFPEAMPDNGDMVSWLLDGQKEGNAVAFASAAVMAYRAAGYPARYTEGYHLSSMDARTALDAGEKELTLTVKNAHAWAEVYISGLGWLPVEVVPGMYTETYTDQLVEGKPSYRVNEVRDESGNDTTDAGTGGGAGKKEKKPAKSYDWKMIPGIVVLTLYLVFALYLLLEFQRAVRRNIRNRQETQMARDGQLVEWYVKDMERLFAAGNIKGGYATDPDALCDEILECFPGIRREEYFRAYELIQKYRFGGMKLLPHELRVLRGMTEHLTKCLYRKQERFLKKLKLRYFYAC